MAIKGTVKKVPAPSFSTDSRKIHKQAPFSKDTAYDRMVYRASNRLTAMNMRKPF